MKAMIVYTGKNLDYAYNTSELRLLTNSGKECKMSWDNSDKKTIRQKLKTYVIIYANVSFDILPNSISVIRNEVGTALFYDCKVNPGESLAITFIENEDETHTIVTF